MENRHLVHKLNVSLISAALTSLDALKQAGIEASLATPEGEGRATSFSITVLLHRRPTIDERITKRATEVLAGVVGVRNAVQQQKLVQNGLQVKMQPDEKAKPKEPAKKVVAKVATKVATKASTKTATKAASKAPAKSTAKKEDTPAPLAPSEPTPELKDNEPTGRYLRAPGEPLL